MPTRLAPLDLTLVALYLVGITLFGLRFSRRSSSGGGSLKSYFLAGNTIPWWAIALSIVSAETSTLTIISIPGVAFTGNFGFLQIVLGYMLGRVVVALLFLPRYLRGEMLTAYQLIARRFGPMLHKLTAGLFLLTRAAAEGVRVFAISIVVSIAIGTGDTLSIAIISGLTLLYTFEGGMAAVIWTDVVQMGLYLAGTLVALWTLGAHVPGGWTHIHAAGASLGKFAVFDFSFSLTKTYTFWAGVLGGTFLTMASHGTDQLMVQRMLAARNLRESRLALLSSGAVIFVQFTIFLLIGAGLWVFYAEHPTTFTSPDRIFPTFIVREMPRGVAGLLVAAILAAAMSNLSAALNSLASTTVVDFYLPWRRRHRAPSIASHAMGGTASENRERTLVSRAATVVWALVLFAIAVYAIHAGGKGHVVETGLSIASVAYGCLLGVFLLGTLTRFATEWGTIVGMACGLALNLWLWLGAFPVQLGPALSVPHIAWTWYVLIGSGVTFAMGALASVVLGKRSTPHLVASALILVSLSCLSSRSAAQGSASAFAEVKPPYDFSTVSTLINGALAQHKLPGAVVVVGHGGKIVFEHAYGNRALEPTVEPMTTDTIFDIASLTKVFTATAVMQLVEQGKVDLDAPVARYLPAFTAPINPSANVASPANGIPAEGRNLRISALTPARAHVTVRDLLTHYSGEPPDVDLKDPWGLATPDKAEGIRRALTTPLTTAPGTKFEYSDINYILLGALVEKMSGQTLSEYAHQNLSPSSVDFEFAYHPADRICGKNPLRGAAVVADSHDADHGYGGSCFGDSWPPVATVWRTAPTAHDDQGTPATNPNFDHLLRSVVHDPTARRMGGVAGHAGIFSTAEDLAKFAQALLDKLLRDTGPFPLTQASLRMMTTPQQPATALADATIFTPSGETTKGVALRGLGWDLNSAFTRPRGELFPLTTTGHPGSFGHTGFTGTSLWIDPVSDSYVILLSNAIHPRGAPPISKLRGEVATAAARALGVGQPTSDTPSRAPSTAPSAVGGTLTGIDVLESTNFAALREAAARHNGHLRLGLLTNAAGLDRTGRRTIDLLATDAAKAVPGLALTTLFSPEHGLASAQDTTHLAPETDPTTHLPVISLYGAKSADRHPRPADLKPLDAVVIDLQDAGVRFWTYETLTGYMLEAAAKAHVEVIVLDRPNPLGGVQVGGPTSDPGLESYTNFMPLPLRHGMTLGELARFFNAEAAELPPAPPMLDARTVQIGPAHDEPTPPATRPGLHAQLTVIPMQGWSRAQVFADTGLTWTPPSPNLRTPTAALLYPGVALLEQTNVSVGRGTPAPFESFGAPWIEAEKLAAYLTTRAIPGVSFSPATLAIVEDANRYPFHGQTVPAVHLIVADGHALDSPELGLELLGALHHLYPAQFELARARTLVANEGTLNALRRGDDPRVIAESWSAALQAFNVKRRSALLYPEK